MSLAVWANGQTEWISQTVRALATNRCSVHVEPCPFRTQLRPRPPDPGSTLAADRFCDARLRIN